MKAKFGSWWEQIWKYRKAIGGVAIVLIVVVVIALIIPVVLSNGTGFNEYTVKSTATETTLSAQTKVITTAQSQPGKTLWDWLQLLIIPLILAAGALLFNFTNSHTERQIALDNQRETALQAYIDKMSELLLKEHLVERRADGKLKPEYDEVRKIARVRTLRVLPRLDKERKRNVIQFLHESHLINKDDPIIDLTEADLRKASLDEAELEGANLSGAKLMGANLSKAKLMNANLDDARLKGARLMKADLSGANLDGADLTRAVITEEQLKEARSLKGTTMPNGSKRP